MQIQPVCPPVHRLVGAGGHAGQGAGAGGEGRAAGKPLVAKALLLKGSLMLFPWHIPPNARCPLPTCCNRAEGAVDAGRQHSRLRCAAQPAAELGRHAAAAVAGKPGAWWACLHACFPSGSAALCQNGWHVRQTIVLTCLHLMPHRCTVCSSLAAPSSLCSGCGAARCSRCWAALPAQWVRDLGRTTCCLLVVRCLRAAANAAAACLFGEVACWQTPPPPQTQR